MSAEKLNKAIAGWCYFFTTLWIAAVGYYGTFYTQDQFTRGVGIFILVAAVFNLAYSIRILDNRLRWLIRVETDSKRESMVFNVMGAHSWPILLSGGLAVLGTHWYYHAGGVVAIIFFVWLMIWVFKRTNKINFIEDDLEGEEEGY